MRHARLTFVLQASGKDLGKIKYIHCLYCLEFTQVRAIQTLLRVLRLEYQESSKVDAKDYHQQKAEP